MEELLELLTQVQEMVGVAIEGIEGALAGGGEGAPAEGAPPPEEGAPPPEEGPPA